MEEKKKTELEKCKESMAYFAANHMLIKKPDGGTRRLTKKELQVIELIEKAQKEGGTLREVKGRKGTFIVIEKQ